jgi:hypothetical protein
VDALLAPRGRVLDLPVGVPGQGRRHQRARQHGRGQPGPDAEGQSGAGGQHGRAVGLDGQLRVQGDAQLLRLGRPGAGLQQRVGAAGDEHRGQGNPAGRANGTPNRLHAAPPARLHDGGTSLTCAQGAADDSGSVHHNILTTQAIAELQVGLDDAVETALQLLLLERDADRAELEAALTGRIVPTVDQRIAALRQTYAGDPDVEPARLERLSDGWADFKRLVRSGLDPGDEAQEQALTRQAVAIIDPITTLVAEMAATEVEHARESQEEAGATYLATRWRVLGIAVTAALVWLAISLLLIRNIVPRVRAYSRFAAGVADAAAR